MADLLPDHDECDDNLPAPPPRRRGRWWKIGCGGILAIMLVIVGSWLIWRSQKLSAIAKLEAEIRARGEPVNAEELNEQFHDLQGAKDKTPLFLAIIGKVGAEEFKEEFRPLPFGGPGQVPDFDPETPWENEAAVRAFLAKHAELLDEIEAAVSAKGRVRLPYDFRQYMTMEFNEIESLRTCARLLNLRARFAAHQGDHDQSLRSVRALVGLSESLQDEPMVIPQIVRISIRSVARNEVAELLRQSEWTDEQIRELMTLFPATGWRESLRATLIGERAIGRVMFDDPGVLAPDDPDAQSAIRQVSLIVKAEDERFFLETMTTCVATAEEPFPEAIARMTLMQQESEAVFETRSWAKTREVYLHSVSYLTFPAIDLFANAMAWNEAKDRAIAAQLAIELYRRQHDGPPATLAELVPDFLSEVPIDPFTGDPLIYRVDEDAIVIYSVGRNKVDDGGVLFIEGEPPKDGMLLDHVVRVLRK